MAIYRPGPLVGAISGSVGTVVFANSRGVAIVHRRPNKKHSRSADQLRQTAIVQREHARFEAWTDNEKLQIQNAANQYPVTTRLGIKRILTARQFWVAAASLDCYSVNWLLYPWVKYPVGDPFTSITLAFAQGGPYTITLAPTTTLPFQVQGTAISRPFKDYELGFYKNWKWLHVSTHCNPTEDFQTPIEARVGPLVTGEVVAIKAYRRSPLSMAPGFPIIGITTVT